MPESTLELKHGKGGPHLGHGITEVNKLEQVTQRLHLHPGRKDTGGRSLHPTRAAGWPAWPTQGDWASIRAVHQRRVCAQSLSPRTETHKQTRASYRGCSTCEEQGRGCSTVSDRQEASGGREQACPGAHTHTHTRTPHSPGLWGPFHLTLPLHQGSRVREEKSSKQTNTSGHLTDAPPASYTRF